MARGKRIAAVTVDDVEKRRIPNKHYVYVITVTWSDGNISVIYRRYSSFFEFQTTLLDSFPLEAGKTNPADRIIPFLPGKIIFGRSHVRDVALKRLEYINLYCKQLIELPKKISEADQVIEFFEPTNEDLVPPNSRGSSADVFQAKSISEPVLLQQYQVLSKYKKAGASEINLRAGEIVDVVEKNQSGWWFVSGEDGQGWVPSSYLDQPEEQEDDDDDDNSGTDRPHLATKSYTPEYADELPLEHGAVVEVMQKNLDGWWQVRSKGREGLVPGSYLTRADTLRAKRIQTALDDFRGSGNTASQGHSSAGDRGGDRDDNVPRSASTPAARHVRPAPDPPASEETSQRTATNGYQQSQSASSGADPHIQAFKDRQERQAKGHHSPSAGSANQEEDLVFAKPPPPRRRTIKKMMSIHPPEVEDDVEDDPDYVTVATFTNHAGDGISFREGATVKVLDKNAGGWWFVSIDGEKGWVPSDYIKRAKQAPQEASKPSKPKQLVREEAIDEVPKPKEVKPKPLPPLPDRPDTPEPDYGDDNDYVNDMPKPPPLPTKGVKPAVKPPEPRRKPKSDGPNIPDRLPKTPQQQAPKSNLVAELADNIRRNKQGLSVDEYTGPATRSRSPNQNVVAGIANNIRSKQQGYTSEDQSEPATRVRNPQRSAAQGNQHRSVVAEIAHDIRNRDSNEHSSSPSAAPDNPNRNLVAQLADNIRSKQGTGGRSDVSGLRHKFEQNW